jgi:hypothetical protein
MPLDGLGTGLSQLPPKLAEILNHEINLIFQTEVTQ